MPNIRKEEKPKNKDHRPQHLSVALREERGVTSGDMVKEKG